MTKHIVPPTQLFDMKGRTITPGLIDSHAHMDREALRRIFPSLGPVRSIKDIQDRIAEIARSKKPGEWIVTMPIGDPPFYVGVPDSLAERRWPTRQELDAAAPNNPVYIRPIWGYWRGTFPLVSCANTAALTRAGITRDTVAPVPSVTIEKDGNGDPTGVFFEEEFAPLVELIWFRDAASFTAADRLRTLPESAKAYHSFGTTSIFEGHGVANELLRTYRRAHHAGTLTMRSTLALSANWSCRRQRAARSLCRGLARLARRARPRRRHAENGRPLCSSRPHRSRQRARRRRALHRLGRASIPTTACRASGSRNCCCIAPRTTSVRPASPAAPATRCSISTKRSTRKSRSRTGAG